MIDDKNEIHQIILDLVHAGDLPVYYDDDKFFVKYHGLRYDLTPQEAGTRPGGETPGLADEFTVAVLHGWDKILQMVGIKSGGKPSN